MLASTPNQILMSPTNNSTAKAQYSFPKASRFPDSKSTTHSFYNIPAALAKRSTTFGYGEKYDFTSDHEKTPDPGAYKIEKDILDKGKAHKFGISREDCKSIFANHFIGDKSVPGPGAYNIPHVIGKDGPAVGILGKKKGLLLNSSSPGPGAYEQKYEKNKGEYLLSTCRSAQSFKFSPNSARFPRNPSDFVPAPGHYETDKGFVKNSQVLSTVRNSGARMFAKSERQPILLKSYSPGPGCYRLPSEFGYYEKVDKDR